MAKIILKINTSGLNGVLMHLVEATSDWPAHKRQSLHDDLIGVLSDGTNLAMEDNGTASVRANAKVFEVLNRYGLNTVC